METCICIIIGSLVGWFLGRKFNFVGRSLDKGYGFAIFSYIASMFLFISILIESKTMAINSGVLLTAVVAACIIDQLYLGDV